VVLLIGTGTATTISLLHVSGYTKLTTDSNSIGWPLITATFIALMVLNDTWFNFWHRLLHDPRIFRHVHAVHHRSVDVNPLSSYSFDCFEGIILGGWVLSMVLLVPIYLPMLSVLVAIGLANNFLSHRG
jgi:sterol desaturase/sphingolipid hydroxylase (fatty acid hydroxylase superfamily)